MPLERLSTARHTNAVEVTRFPARRKTKHVAPPVCVNGPLLQSSSSCFIGRSAKRPAENDHGRAGSMRLVVQGVLSMGGGCAQIFGHAQHRS